MSNLPNYIRNELDGLAALLGQHWRKRFYLYLAVGFTIFVALDAAVLHYTAGMRQSSFDAMLRYRVIVPKPDPDIVIVDINVASLAAMGEDYVHLPRQRHVLAVLF